MNHKMLIVEAFLIVVLVLGVACAPQAAPAPAPAMQAPAPAPAAAVAPVATSKPAWQEKWENTMVLAKKEGSVAIHTGGGAAVRMAVMEIAKMQGLDAEVVGERSDEFIVRARAERRAGLYLHDVWLSSPSTMLTDAKPAGMVQSIEPALILPDVTDPDRIKNIWYKSELPWVDRDRTSFATTITGQTPIVINTNLVKPDEVKSWRDLLNPKWKGKMILADPSVSGAGNMGLAAIDGIMGWDYIKELAKMEPIVLRDQRLQLDWLAHGKMSILVCPKPDLLREFLKLGVPIKGIVPSEGTWVSTGSGGLGFLSREPHPNAARVFINWYLSKEGQTIFSRAIGFQSAREDVPTDHLRSEDIRQADVKYYNGYSEEASAGPRRVEINKLAKELFGTMVTK